MSWERGMSLYEFADFCVDLGFVNAVNLDGEYVHVILR